MANYCLGSWRNWFPGIDHARGMATMVSIDGVEIERELNINALRIDLKAPGLGFFTTPPRGKFQTENETILEFLVSANYFCGVTVAINAGLAACEQPAGKGAAASLFGLAKSMGHLVSDPTVPAPQPSTPTGPDVPDGNSVGTVALVISKDNQASFQIINAANPGEGSPWPSVYTAVSGSPQPQAWVSWPPGPFVGGLTSNRRWC